MGSLASKTFWNCLRFKVKGLIFVCKQVRQGTFLLCVDFFSAAYELVTQGIQARGRPTFQLKMNGLIYCDV